MLIDSIAPDGMKASYFSAQSLGLLGGAFNPMLTGVVLTELPLFYFHYSYVYYIFSLAIHAKWNASKKNNY